MTSPFGYSHQTSTCQGYSSYDRPQCTLYKLLTVYPNHYLGHSRMFKTLYYSVYPSTFSLLLSLFSLQLTATWCQPGLSLMNKSEIMLDHGFVLMQDLALMQIF